MAKAAGFPTTGTVYNAAQLRTWISKIHQPGLVFVDIKVTMAKAPLILPPRDGTLLKQRFREAVLGESA